MKLLCLSCHLLMIRCYKMCGCFSQHEKSIEIRINQYGAQTLSGWSLILIFSLAHYTRSLCNVILLYTFVKPHFNTMCLFLKLTREYKNNLKISVLADVIENNWYSSKWFKSYDFSIMYLWPMIWNLHFCLRIIKANLNVYLQVCCKSWFTTVNIRTSTLNASRLIELYDNEIYFLNPISKHKSLQAHLVVEIEHTHAIFY